MGILSELNEKESPRLKWGSEILNKIGIKNLVTSNSIKIYSFTTNYQEELEEQENQLQFISKPIILSQI